MAHTLEERTIQNLIFYKSPRECNISPKGSDGGCKPSGGKGRPPKGKGFRPEADYAGRELYDNYMMGS